MLAWDVVITVNENHFKQARELLQAFGELSKTDFYNVLVLRADQPVTFLGELEAELTGSPEFKDCLSRVMPVQTTFDFQIAQEFETKAAEAVEQWLDTLAGSSFHVRMHRRGFRGRLFSQHEERFLDHHIREQLQAQGKDASVNFDDPDYILAVETVGQRAGLSLWSREVYRRHPLLKLD